MKSKKLIALVLSATVVLSNNTLVFSTDKKFIDENKVIINNGKKTDGLKNNLIQVNNLIGEPWKARENFITLEEGILKIGFDEENKKLKVFDIQSTYFSTLTNKMPYFILKVLDANWIVKKEITFRGDELTGWEKEKEINNFEYNYGDILSISSIIPQAIYIHGKILGLPEDYPYIRPNSNINYYNFQITKDGLKAVHNPYTQDETLGSTIIDIRNEFSHLSKYMKWHLMSSDAFKIKFDENSKQFKIIDRKDDYYLNKYLRYDDYFKFFLYDKDKKLKFSLNLSGYDTGKSEKLDSLNNLNFEYGDIIKIWCKSTVNQRILGKIFNASTDYSKGIKNIKDLEETYFEITPKGLKEIKNKPPEILGLEDVIIRKGDHFDNKKNITAIDDFDGDVTKDLNVFGDVNTNVIGTYNLRYQVADSNNKITEATRKVIVIEKPKLEENVIKCANILNYELFNISFNDLTKKFKVNNHAKEYLNSYLQTSNYFSLKIFDKNHKEKFYISLDNFDFNTHKKLEALHNFKFEYGDFITINQKYHKNLKIDGNIINKLEDYSDGVDFIENIENVYFEITKDGLKSHYNSIPVINGVKNRIIKVGDNFNALEDINVNDDFDKDLIVNVTGNVNKDKAGVYNLIYSVKDTLGKLCSRKSKVTVRELTLLEKNTIIVEGYDNRQFVNIGFDSPNKKLILSRFNTNSYFHGGYNEFFKIKIKSKEGKEKLLINIEGKDSSSSHKLNPLNNFSFEYGDIVELWHASPIGVNGGIKINGKVLNNGEDYTKGLSLDAILNTKFEITNHGLKAIYNENPTISGISPVILKIGDSFDPLEGVSVSDDLDSNLVPILDKVIDTNIVGDYTLTYTVRDSGGREVIATRNIIIKTNEKPILIGINDIKIKAGTPFNKLLGINAMDKEDGDLSKSIVVKGDVDVNTPSIYKLDYLVEDSDGNIAKEIRLINVRSNKKPVFSGISNLTIKINDDFDPLDGVTAIDNEDLDLTNSINVKGIVDKSKLGNYDLIYSVKDNDDNETVKTRRITVRSNEKPVIEGAYNEIIKVGDVFNPLKGIIVTDKEDKDLTSKITILGNVNTSKEGVYNLFYTVEDSDGNICEIKRVITVKTNNKPKFLGLNDINIFIGELFDPYAYVKAIDKEEGDITHRIKVKGQVDTNTIGQYELIYYVLDLDDNETLEKRIITVKSNEKPEIIGNDLTVIKVGDKFDPLEGIVVTDKEDGDLKNSLNIKGEVKKHIPGDYHLTYSVIDSDGNKTIFKRNIVVRSNEKPVISGANDIVIKAGESFDLYHGVIAYDTEDGNITSDLVINGDIDTSILGDYNISYSVIDKDKNKVEKIRKITVKSNEKPVITGANAITIKVGDEFNDNLGVKAIDKEDGDLTSKINIFGKVDNSKEGVTTLVYSIEDNDGNITTIKRIVKVRSNDKPQIFGANDLILKEGDAFNPLEDILAKDTEDGIITEKIKVNGNVDTSKIGQYKIIYSIKDSDENITKVEREIIVKSNKKPIIHGANDKLIKIGDTFNPLEGITVTDFEDMDLTNKILVIGNANTNLKGTYKLTYSVTDSDNNITTIDRVITVRSNSKPELFGIEDTIIKVGESFENSSLGILAMDEEDGDITKLVSISGFVDNNVLGEYTLTYSVTDSDNNKTEAKRKVIVKSNENPIITGADPITIKVGDYFEANLGIKALDKEDGDLTYKISILGNVDTSKEGVNTLLYSVEDSDGNVTHIRRRVKVRTNHKPEIFGADTVIIKEGDVFHPLKGVLAKDGEDGIITKNIIVKGDVDTSKVREYKLIYHITDSDKNTIKVERKVIVQSNKKPIINGTDSVIIKMGDDFNALEGVTASDFEDTDLTNKILVVGNVNTNLKGNYKLKYSVRDSDNNITTIVRVITVRSNSRPEIFGAEDIIIKSGDNFENTSVGILAMDEEDGDISHLVDIKGFVDSTTEGVYKLIYSVIDSDGNISEVERKVIVKSNEKPIITGADAITIKMGDNFDANLGVIAMDKEDGELTTSLNILGKIDTSKEGVNTLLYSVEDSDGNITHVRRRIKVRTNHKPKIFGADVATVKEGSEFHVLEGILAQDSEDGIITKNIKVIGNVDTFKTGEYFLVYTITDSDGNSTEIKRKVIVKSNKKPIIIGDYNKIIKVGDAFNPLEGITAYDFEDKDLTNKVLFTGNVNINKKGNYKLKYSVRDSDNNITTIERIITVRSNSKPEIFGIEDIIIKVGDNFDSSSLSILAMDKEDGDITKLVSIKGFVDSTIEGVYKLNYSVIDSDGNIVEAERKVIVKSNEKPIIIGVEDYVIQAGDTFNPLHGVTALDKESGDLTNKIKIEGKVDTLTEGNYEIIYSVTDNDGNKTFENSLITVISNEKPKLLNLEDTIIKQGDKFDPYNEGIIALDKEDGDITEKIKIEGTVDTSNIGEYNLIYSVEDYDGNITKATKKVMVRSNSIPIIEGILNKIIKVGENFNDREGVLAKDFEDGDITSLLKIEGNVDASKAGIYNLNYYVNDSDGNITRKTRKIIVRSNNKPIITGADDISIKVGDRFIGYLGVEAIDTEDIYLTNFLKINGFVNTKLPGKYSLIYSVIDSDNNETRVKRIVTVESNEKPMINGANNIVLKAGDPFNPLEGITATDKEDGVLTDNIQVLGEVNTNKSGIYTVVYKIVDKDNNITKVIRKIRVKSNEKPVIFGMKDLKINQYERFNTMIRIKALDKEDGDLTKLIKIKGVVDTSRVGEYTLTYYVNDKDGNEISASRKITVVSNEKPIITEYNKLVIKKGDSFNALYGISALDKEDGDISYLLTTVGTVDTNKLGIYIINYSVVDSDGNKSTFVRKVLVRSNEKPIILGNENVTLNINDNFNPLSEIVARDKEDGDLTEKIVVKGEVDTSKTGEYHLNYSVIDSDGNETISTREVIVKEINEIEAIGIENIEVMYGSNFDPMDGIKILDSHKHDLTSSIVVEGYVNTLKEGIYELIYLIKDDDGKEIRYFREITVKAKDEIESDADKDNNIIKEFLAKKTTKEIFPKYKKDYSNFNIYKENSLIKNFENVYKDDLNEDLPINIDNISKESSDKLEPFKDNISIKAVNIQELPPYDKNAKPLWLIGLFLVILGRKLKEKEKEE